MAKFDARKWGPASIWKALGMDTQTFLMMLKGGLPPTIVIAMYAEVQTPFLDFLVYLPHIPPWLQATPVANTIQNYAYVSAIMAVISQCILPRAKFMKTMLLCVLSVCVSASLCCLGVFCAVKARQHTAAPGAAPDEYNSSASAVSAIWFLFGTWIGNTIRAHRPIELQPPMASFSIFIVISMTRAPRIPTLANGLQSVRQLLLAFLIGFAIAAGVSLFILPTTSRGTFLSRLRNYPASVSRILDAQVTYIRHSEDDGPWKITRRATLSRLRSRRRTQTDTSNPEKKTDKPAVPESEKRANELHAAMDDLHSSHSQASAELHFAKQELVWGKMTAEDLEKLFLLIRGILLPLTGAAMLPQVFKRLNKKILAVPISRFSTMSEPGPYRLDRIETFGSQYEVPETPQVSEEHFVGPLCDRLEAAAMLVNDGLKHGFLTLGLGKRKDFEKTPPKKRRFSFLKWDEESPVDDNEPGRPGFLSHFEQRILEYYSQRKSLPETWASLNAFTPIRTSETDSDAEAREIRKEFFALIFIIHLQDVLLQAVLDLATFADEKVADGTMERRRFIFPKRENVKEWLFSGGPDENKGREDEEPIAGEGGTAEAPDTTDRRPRDPMKSRYSDPEHLPPTNAWQKFGIGLRLISHFLTSDQSAFGFRVAIAAFCAAILAYLHPTQKWFYENRINWAVVVIVIGMSPTSGNSLFGLIGRIVATSISTALTFAVWYIVAGKTAGIIVFLYVANCLHYYPYVKYPRFIPAITIALITFNLIIAYELSVRKLGIAVATSTGLKYYPIYLFGPHRLVAVIAGCGIMFFWVIFPGPTSAGSYVRKTLGRSLFVLANFYSCMHTSIGVWIDQEQGDINDSQSPARLLENARNKLFTEEMSLLQNLRIHSEFTVFEPSIGGKFPKKTYDAIISEIQSILTCMDLMAHTTRNLERMAGRESTSKPRATMEPDTRSPERSGSSGAIRREEKWVSNLARAASSPDFHAHVVSSVLYHLSAAISNRLSLPPYLSPPHPFPLARTLRQMDEDLLNIRNVEDPSFSAFVALEVLSSMMSSNLKNLIADVKLLVGELNFDMYVRPHRRRVLEDQRRGSARQRSNRS